MTEGVWLTSRENGFKYKSRQTESQMQRGRNEGRVGTGWFRWRLRTTLARGLISHIRCAAFFIT